MLMQTEVKAVPPSLPAGRLDLGRMRNWSLSMSVAWEDHVEIYSDDGVPFQKAKLTSGTTSLNHASSLIISATQSPTAVLVSFARR